MVGSGPLGAGEERAEAEFVRRGGVPEDGEGDEGDVGPYESSIPFLGVPLPLAML